MDKEAVDIPWPPTPPATAPRPRQVQSGSSLDLCVACGDSHSTFCFSLYKYPTNNPQNQIKQVLLYNYVCLSDREFSMVPFLQKEPQLCNVDAAQGHSFVDVREPTP